jgi:8-amino-7-oxononanoate synthase
MIVVDGIFSMEGDICNLPEIIKLAETYGSMVMVDDAHALGVIGRGGRGTASHFGMTNRVDLIMSTFSKSLASLGGFVASTKEIIHYMRHHARSLIFSASIPPSAAAAAMAALEVMQQEPERLEQLWENSAYLARAVREIGFDTANVVTPIVPIYIRDNQLTFQFTQRLFEEGIFVNPVVSPAVRSDASMIRMSITATHTRAQLDEAIEKLDQIAAELQVFELIEKNNCRHEH